MKKKILSLLLAVVMLASILPMSAISAYAAVITEETVVTNLNVGDIVVRGTNIKVATHTYKRKVNNRTQTVVVPLLTVNGENYGTIIRYVNNDSCVKITSQESTVSETTGAKDYKDIITVENACNYVPYNKISDATVDAPAQYESKCTYCNAVATGPVGDKLPSAVISYVDPSTGETVEKQATNDTVGTIVDELLSKPMQNNKEGIFLGWYADGEALQKGTSRFDALTDITAGYTPVKQIEKDFNDDKMIASYKSFGLAGVQIREDNTQELDKDGNEISDEVYGGLRYVASFSEQLKSIVENNANVEYGFVMASRANAEMFADHYGVAYDKYEIKYNTGVNGGTADTDYRYVTNVVCSNNIDHRNFDGYRLFTAVIDYEGAESLKNTEFVARAYVKYVDANGNTQIYYDDYDGTTTFGGCSISYNRALAMSM